MTTRIRSFFASDAEFIEPLTDETPLHFRDLTAVYHYLAHIEREFGLSIVDEEVLPENFASIAATAAFVEMKKRRGSQRSNKSDSI